MTDRQKTRQRPNPRRALWPNLRFVARRRVDRRSVLKGFFATHRIGRHRLAPSAHESG